MKSLMILSFLILSSFFNHTTSSSMYNAIVSFGDSFADTGNYDTLESSVPSNPFAHLPYGETYFKRNAGRASDGRIILDFIAQALGFPFVPPYLAKDNDFSKGANFAVILANALDITFFQQNNISNPQILNTSLNVQLGWFQDLKPSLCNTTQSCKDYLCNSLFIVGEFGGNDYNFLLSAGQTVNQVRSYVPMIIKTIQKAAESLLNQGAMHMVLPGIVPVGCVPRILALFASPNKLDYDHLGCLREYNTIGNDHNTQLQVAVSELRLKFPLARISYAEYDVPVIQFLQTPDAYGFTNGAPLRVCCGSSGGSYNYNASDVCGEPGVMSCDKPSTYINWDGLHLTEAAYNLIAAGWLKGPYADPPILEAV